MPNVLPQQSDTAQCGLRVPKPVIGQARAASGLEKQLSHGCLAKALQKRLLRSQLHFSRTVSVGSAAELLIMVATRSGAHTSPTHDSAGEIVPVVDNVQAGGTDTPVEVIDVDEESDGPTLKSDLVLEVESEKHSNANDRAAELGNNFEQAQLNGTDSGSTIDAKEIATADLLQFFSDEAAEQPTLFMGRSAKTTASCRKLLKQLYDEQSALESTSVEPARRKRKRARSSAPLGPLARIDVSAVFEVDQVWEELALRNAPMRAFLEREVVRAAKRKAAEVSKMTVAAGKTAAECERDIGADIPGVGDEVEEEYANGDEAVEEDELGGVEQDSLSSDGTAKHASEPSTKKVRFSVDAGSDIDSDGAGLDGGEGNNGAGKLEDGFFNLADMEAFGDEAEKLASAGKLMADSDEEEEANEFDFRERGLSDDDEDEEEEGLGPSLRGKLKGMASKTEERIRYDDFFDKPGGGDGPGGKTSEESERALRRATMFDTGSSDDEANDEDQSNTPLDLERKQVRSSISALEDANVSKKPWQLRGEVDAHGRPKNSLLESEFEHDIVARPRVAPTAAATASIEDIIRQRIFDGLFDDPVRTLPADYEEARKKKQRAPLPEISQEKPQEGLAELYEKEFAEERGKVSKAAEAASSITVRDVDPEDSPEQAEVNRLFKRLSNRLDSLASLHFTPAPPKMPSEMEVKPNVPAMNVEEAIPEAVSDAALLAPREVHAAEAGDLQGEVETDKLERRARRRTKKRHISKDNKRKDGEDREAEMADPELAETRRAERTLQRPGKMLKAVANPNHRNKSKKKRNAVVGSLDDVGSRKCDFSKSTRFFTQLQDTVQKDLAGKKSKMGARELPGGASAARLKL